jgi:hypothetical protein
MAVVVYKDRMAPALVGDLGPGNKIGEASIRVHELLRPAVPDPCSLRDAEGFCGRIRNASVSGDILYFVFQNSAFESGIEAANVEEKVTERSLNLFRRLRGW